MKTIAIMFMALTLSINAHAGAVLTCGEVVANNCNCGSGTTCGITGGEAGCWTETAETPTACPGPTPSGNFKKPKQQVKQSKIK